MCRGWALKKTTVCAFLLLYISQTTLAKLLFIHNFSSNFRPVGGRKKTSERRGKLQKSFNLENMGEGGTTYFAFIPRHCQYLKHSRKLPGDNHYAL